MIYFKVQHELLMNISTIKAIKQVKQSSELLNIINNVKIKGMGYH